MAELKTQGTRLYVHNPVTAEVYKVGGVTSIGSASAPVSQIDTTDLESLVRTYAGGLREPGTTSFTIKVDPSNPDHAKLYELYKTSDVVDFIVALTDGEDAPTAADGEVTLPSTTSFITFSGFITEYPMSFEVNSLVMADISIQISGDVGAHFKVAA